MALMAVKKRDHAGSLPPVRVGLERKEELMALATAGGARSFASWIRDAVEAHALGAGGGVALGEGAMESLAVLRDRYARLSPSDTSLVAMALEAAALFVQRGEDLTDLAPLPAPKKKAR